MRLIRFLLLAVLFGVAAPALTPKAQAAPIAASPLAHQTAAPDLTEQARLYCYDRYTGRFLHWGPCYRRHYVYRRYYYRPHYYHRYHYWHRRHWRRW